MNAISGCPVRRTRAVVRAAALATALGGWAFASACADKGLTPPPDGAGSRVTLQVTAFASQQATFGPRWLLVAALYAVPASDGSGGTGVDFRLLAHAWVPYAAGSQQVTLSVPLATCLADDSRLGARDACSMYLGAALLADTLALADTTDSDPLARAFDDRFPLGPFVFGAGRAPTIPPIDLSASRHGVVQWVGDDGALRLSNPSTASTSGPITGIPLAGGGVALLGLGTGELGVFESGTWRRIGAAGVASFFRGATAFAMNDIYMASGAGLHRYDGTAFTRVPVISDSLLAVSGAATPAGKFVIAGGANGVVWIGDTQTWVSYPIATPQPIDGVCITGPAEAFAASSRGGGVWRFNGTAWASVPPATGLGATFGLQCPGPGQAFVMGTGGNFGGANGGGLFRWSGAGWSAFPTTGLNKSRPVLWGVVSANEIYAYGDSANVDRAFYRYDGSAWREAGRLRFTQGNQIQSGAMWADPRGGAAYVPTSFGRLERVTASGVSVMSYEPSLRDVSMSSATSAFAVGWNLFLARWDGTRWTVDTPPPATPTVRILQGVWSDGPANAWAVGGASTILRYNGSGWSVVSDVWHPVATSDNYNAVWGNASNVWIVGNTILRCSAAGGCVTEAGVPATTLYGIWGTADGSVRFAVGDGGKILTATGSGAWQSMASPTSHTLVRVAGSSATDVWALGDSVVLHYDGTSWTNVPMTGDLAAVRSRAPSLAQGLFQLGLWVRSADEVYIGGDAGGIVRYDSRSLPQGWRLVKPNQPSGRRIIAIAGLPGGCAVALTGPGGLRTEPQLWRGIGPSGCLQNPMAMAPGWP